MNNRNCDMLDMLDMSEYMDDQRPVASKYRRAMGSQPFDPRTRSDNNPYTVRVSNSGGQGYDPRFFVGQNNASRYTYRGIPVREGQDRTGRVTLDMMDHVRRMSPQQREMLRYSTNRDGSFRFGQEDVDRYNNYVKSLGGSDIAHNEKSREQILAENPWTAKVYKKFAGT